LNQELKVKLIKLFEEHFFIGIVAFKTDIYRDRIYEWEREQKSFNNAVTHARGRSKLNSLLNYLNSITGGLKNYDILH
jgi:7,8-dihydro-6-hydroxymethylpterin-pyrophosphokinase